MTVSDSQSREQFRGVCLDALEWARAQDYAGWDPYDGLNSPYLQSVARGWFSRLLATHLVDKAPVNVRPYLDVPKERNPKGIALFAMTHLNLYESGGEEDHLRESERLLEWLRENQSTAYELPCWGYNFGWQNARKFYLPPYAPSIVVSTFCARAFLRHFEVTGDEQSLRTAARTVEFVRTHIGTREIDGFRVFTYTDSDSFVVVNANALAAGLFGRVADATGETAVRDHATELAEFVTATQADSGAWYYAVPRSESHLSHDNFHTGFVLEGLGRFLDSCGPAPSVEEAYDRGLAFYRRELFEDDGAPKFEHDRSYPRDAHSAGQAIRTFALDGSEASLTRARSVARWSVDRLYDEDGYFYRRRGRLFDDRTPYMRWSQAWMCYGLSSYLKSLDPPGGTGHSHPESDGRDESVLDTRVGWVRPTYRDPPVGVPSWLENRLQTAPGPNQSTTGR